MHHILVLFLTQSFICIISGISAPQFYPEQNNFFGTVDTINQNYHQCNINKASCIQSKINIKGKIEVNFDNDCTGTLISSNHILTSNGCLKSLGTSSCNQNLISGYNPKTGQTFTANLIAFFAFEPIKFDSVIIAVMDKEIRGYPKLDVGNIPLIPLTIKNFIISKTHHSYNYILTKNEKAIVYGKKVSSSSTELRMISSDGSKTIIYNCPQLGAAGYKLSVKSLFQSGSNSTVIDCGGDGADFFQNFKSGSKTWTYDKPDRCSTGPTFSDF